MQGGGGVEKMRPVKFLAILLAGKFALKVAYKKPGTNPGSRQGQPPQIYRLADTFPYCSAHTVPGKIAGKMKPAMIPANIYGKCRKPGTIPGK